MAITTSAHKQNTAVDHSLWDGAMAQKQSDRKGKCRKRRSTSSNGLTRRSISLLRADMDDQDKSIVSTLWCVVCRKYETRTCRLKKFSRAWIDGSSNHKTSNITDHANIISHDVLA